MSVGGERHGRGNGFGRDLGVGEQGKKLASRPVWLDPAWCVRGNECRRDWKREVPHYGNLAAEMGHGGREAEWVTSFDWTLERFGPR